MYVTFLQDTLLIVDELTKALGRDARLASHPLVHDVNHPDEIAENYDPISYSKVIEFDQFPYLEPLTLKISDRVYFPTFVLSPQGSVAASHAGRFSLSGNIPSR